MEELVKELYEEWEVASYDLAQADLSSLSGTLTERWWEVPDWVGLFFTGNYRYLMK